MDILPRLQLSSFCLVNQLDLLEAVLFKSKDPAHIPDSALAVHDLREHLVHFQPVDDICGLVVVHGFKQNGPRVARRGRFFQLIVKERMTFAQALRLLDVYILARNAVGTRYFATYFLFNSRRAVLYG